jgi:hypothetical protein
MHYFNGAFYITVMQNKTGFLDFNVFYAIISMLKQIDRRFKIWQTRKKKVEKPALM